MSLEKKERRICDICGEMISGDYYRCEKSHFIYNDSYVKTPEYQDNSVWSTWYPITDKIVCNYPPATPPKIDVCSECWGKLQPKEA